MKLVKREPFWFSEKGIELIEKRYNAKYLGFWCIKDRNGNWSEKPVEVFYQANPDFSKGHSHYFGIFTTGIGQVVICNAESAFEKAIIGILEDDKVYVSRYRHDFNETPKGSIIDGGRDYLRLGGPILPSVYVTIKDGEFIFE